MVRIKATVARRKGRKRVMKQAKGQFGRRKNNYTQAIRSVIKGMAYAYRDRKVKKREYRALWIVRINAACRLNGISYSKFIKGLKDKSIDLDRKTLAHLAMHEPEAFKALV